MYQIDKHIDSFFNDMSDILSKNESQKCNGECNSCEFDTCINLPTNKIKMNNSQRTNVIYLNTDCNLRCTYCYESSSKNGLEDQANCTPKMIDDFLNEICVREKDCISTIVIMGGEPFLKFDLIQYTIAKTIELVSQGKAKGFGLSLITNATLFNSIKLNALKSLIEYGKHYNISFNLEISYDGSGQFKRKFPDGTNSKDIVEESIKTLSKYKIPFKISYTVHSGNYDKVIDDTIYILEKFNSDYLSRITIGYAYQELDDTLKQSHVGKTIKEKNLPYLKSIFERYKIPICGHVCDICRICEKDNFIGNSYLSPTTGITYDEKETKHEFRQF